MKGREVCLTAILLLFVFATQLCNVQAENSEDVCRYFPNNTKIRDPDSCSNYFTCIDFVSHKSSCTGSTPFYNKDDEKCVKSITDDSNCHVTCENAASTFIADPKSCKGYYYCADEEVAIPGTCPENTHFNVTRQSCILKIESDCTAEQFDYCAIVKNGKNFRKDKACHQYYVCTKGELTVKTCSKKYYDPISGTCVEKSNVACEEHPLPKDVCGTAKSPKKNAFVDDGATCRGYFFCATQPDNTPDAHPYWNQCPENTFFLAKKGTCVHPLDVKCTWDRCDGRTLPFVTAAKKGCRHYLRCVDGITAETLSCGNLFFDERAGGCTSTIVNEAACNS